MCITIVLRTGVVIGTGDTVPRLIQATDTVYWCLLDLIIAFEAVLKIQSDDIRTYVYRLKRT